MSINIFNRKKQKFQRQHLRKNMTKAEMILWSKLKGKQMIGLKFRRQFGVGQFIVDFYSPEIKLAIELDGDVHAIENQIAKDKEKQRFIEKLGIKILRYTNEDVITNINAVLENLFGVITPLYSPLQRGKGKGLIE